MIPPEAKDYTIYAEAVVMHVFATEDCRISESRANKRAWDIERAIMKGEAAGI